MGLSETTEVRSQRQSQPDPDKTYFILIRFHILKKSTLPPRKTRQKKRRMEESAKFRQTFFYLILSFLFIILEEKLVLETNSAPSKTLQVPLLGVSLPGKSSCFIFTDLFSYCTCVS